MVPEAMNNETMLQTINYQVLEKLRQDMGVDIDPMIQKLLSKLPDRMHAIGTAIKQENPDALLDEAHRLKGGARTIGAEQLADLCVKLERMGKERRLHHATTLFTKIKEASNQVKKALEKG